jgi:hypothetical protein
MVRSHRVIKAGTNSLTHAHSGQAGADSASDMLTAINAITKTISLGMSRPDTGIPDVANPVPIAEKLTFSTKSGLQSVPIRDVHRSRAAARKELAESRDSIFFSTHLSGYSVIGDLTDSVQGAPVYLSNKSLKNFRGRDLSNKCDNVYRAQCGKIARIYWISSARPAAVSRGTSRTLFWTRFMRRQKESHSNILVRYRTRPSPRSLPAPVLARVQLPPRH